MKRVILFSTLCSLSCCAFFGVEAMSKAAQYRASIANSLAPEAVAKRIEKTRAAFAKLKEDGKEDLCKKILERDSLNLYQYRNVGIYTKKDRENNAQKFKDIFPEILAGDLAKLDCSLQIDCVEEVESSRLVNLAFWKNFQYFFKGFDQIDEADKLQFCEKIMKNEGFVKVFVMFIKEAHYEAALSVLKSIKTADSRTIADIESMVELTLRFQEKKEAEENM